MRLTAAKGVRGPGGIARVGIRLGCYVPVGHARTGGADGFDADVQVIAPPAIGEGAFADALDREGGELLHSVPPVCSGETGSGPIRAGIDWVTR